MDYILAISPRVIVVNSIFFAVCAACWLRGQSPEKIASSTIGLMMLADLANHAIFGPSKTYGAIIVGHLLIDAAALVSFLFLALFANRIYPLCLLGSQLVATVMHLDRLISPYMSPLAYAILNRLPFYIQLITIAVGLTLHIRRVRANGSYPSWRRR